MKSKDNFDRTERLMKAVSFAARTHQGQLRKDGKTPYAAHPFRVALTLRHVFGIDNDRMLAAALLHDVVEDTNTDYDQLAGEFGREVAEWVGLLTKDKRLPEPERERAYYSQLSRAPLEVKLIKLADAHDNLIDSATSPRAGRKKVLKRAREVIRTFARDRSPEFKRCLTILKKRLSQISRRA